MIAQRAVFNHWRRTLPDMMKALLVHDTLSERVLLTELLGRMGHRVVCAVSADEAGRLFHRDPPDLVILNSRLPDDDPAASALARTLRGLSDDWLPILFLTDRCDPATVTALLAAGGDDCIVKPVDETLLGARLRLLERMLGRRSETPSESGRTTGDREDLLTGVANRAQLQRHLEREAAQCARHNTPLSLILVSIDDFQAYHAHCGHLAGDSCLKKLAHLLTRSVSRPADLVGRYDEQRFGIVLPETDADGARHLAERLQRTICERSLGRLAGDAPGRCMTLSLGISSQTPEPGTEAAPLLDHAAAALRAAQRQGGNRVVLQ